MNVSSRFRGLARFWRVGTVVLAVGIVLLVALIMVGRHGGTTDALGKTSLPRATPVAYATSAAGVSIAPAATAAPRPAVAAAPTTAAAAPASGVTGQATSGGSSSNASVLNAPLPPTTIDQKLIRTGALTITTNDVPGIQNEIWNLAARLGGAVITSNTTGTGDTIRGDITFRVPSEQFKIAMDNVKGYAVKVEKEQTTAQDVTEDYVDLQARQRNLEATSVQLQSLLSKATTVDETLKVQVQLNNVQSDLERIKGKLNYYDTRTSNSTIQVSILPVPPPAKPEPVTPVAKWSFAHSIREAWNRSVNGLQNVADALITIVIGGWWIEVPLVIAIFLLARHSRRRTPAPALVPVPHNDTPPPGQP